MAETVFFYVFTSLMLAAAVSVVRHRSPMYSVLSLLVVMFCLSGLFVMLGATFLAAIQLLLYAGAVLVLFLYVLMLLNLSPDTLNRARVFIHPAAGIAAAGLLFAGLWKILTQSPLPTQAQGQAVQAGTIEAVGRLLFRDYLLPFELTSFLILAAIIGAVTLAKGKSS
jgi:NADH-quinone oxidoreductase subunit J